MADQAASQAKKKIVVVEDDEDFLTLVSMMLADERLEVIPALDGEAGLEAIRAHRPDVVILDLILPDMNGWEVFMQMRNEAASKDIPVIILTNQGTRHDRTFSLHVAQVHDYLTKPCLPSHLRQSVTMALGENGERRN
jgi:two-component system response regulator VicR